MRFYVYTGRLVPPFRNPAEGIDLERKNQQYQADRRKRLSGITDVWLPRYPRRASIQNVASLMCGPPTSGGMPRKELRADTALGNRQTWTHDSWSPQYPMESRPAVHLPSLTHPNMRVAHIDPRHWTVHGPPTIGLPAKMRPPMLRTTKRMDGGTGSTIRAHGRVASAMLCPPGFTPERPSLAIPYR